MAGRPQVLCYSSVAFSRRWPSGSQGGGACSCERDRRWPLFLPPLPPHATVGGLRTALVLDRRCYGSCSRARRRLRSSPMTSILLVSSLCVLCGQAVLFCCGVEGVVKGGERREGWLDMSCDFIAIPFSPLPLFVNVETHSSTPLPPLHFLTTQRGVACQFPPAPRGARGTFACAPRAPVAVLS